MNETTNEKPLDARTQAEVKRATDRALLQVGEQRRLEKIRKGAEDHAAKTLAERQAFEAQFQPGPAELAIGEQLREIAELDPREDNPILQRKAGSLKAELRFHRECRSIRMERERKKRNEAKRPIVHRGRTTIANVADVLYVVRDLHVGVTVGGESFALPYPVVFVSAEEDARLWPEVEAFNARMGRPRVVRLEGDARWNAVTVMETAEATLPEQWLSYVDDVFLLLKWAIESEGTFEPLGRTPISKACLGRLARIGEAKALDGSPVVKATHAKQVETARAFWREQARARAIPRPETERAADADGGAA